MEVIGRFNVKVTGQPDAQPMVFAHGYGCDQNMWRYVAPRFEDDFRVVLFDHVGAGGSDVSAYDATRYASLDAYAADVLELCRALDLADVVFVGHSVSAMIGVLAAVAEPERFAKLVLVGPSPRYIDDGDYVGGFSEEDITELLDSLDSNYLGMVERHGPGDHGQPRAAGAGGGAHRQLLQADPDIARNFARATFLSDNRADLARASTPSLVLQCSNDVIAPVAVGTYVTKSRLAARWCSCRLRATAPT